MTSSCGMTLLPLSFHTENNLQNEHNSTQTDINNPTINGKYHKVVAQVTCKT